MAEVIAFVGSRSWTDKAAVEYAVEAWGRRHQRGGGLPLIISGGAEGPDTWAIETAERLGLPTHVFEPKARTKPAFLARNRVLAEACDIVVGFIDLGSPTQGAAYTLCVAHHMGRDVVRITNEVYAHCAWKRPDGSICQKELGWHEFQRGLIGDMSFCFPHDALFTEELKRYEEGDQRGQFDDNLSFD